MQEKDGIRETEMRQETGLRRPKTAFRRQDTGFWRQKTGDWQETGYREETELCKRKTG